MAITSEAYAGQSPGYGSGLLINKEDGLFRYTMAVELWLSNNCLWLSQLCKCVACKRNSLHLVL